MTIINGNSPQPPAPGNAGAIMRQVLCAVCPGVMALTYFFGWGILTNILWSITVALVCETTALKLRQRPVGVYLKDYSAVMTAILLAIALPAGSSWWLIGIGTGFAILVVKHLYGGVGYNLFNPAMAGYALLLIAFPLEMSCWPAPIATIPEQPPLPGLLDSLAALFGLLDLYNVDGFTMATPLAIVKQNNALMIDVLWSQHPQFGRWGSRGWEWASLLFLAGGLYLLWKKIFTWHAPVGMLLVLLVLSGLFYDDGSSASGGQPLMHLLSGSTMLSAFFIITDPVTSATSNRGRLIHGAGIGVLVFIIRVWGSYPDAVAFAVLLMNFAAPFIDNHTRPAAYAQHDARDA